MCKSAKKRLKNTKPYGLEFARQKGQWYCELFDFTQLYTNIVFVYIYVNFDLLLCTQVKNDKPLG